MVYTRVDIGSRAGDQATNSLAPRPIRGSGGFVTDQHWITFAFLIQNMDQENSHLRIDG